MAVLNLKLTIKIVFLYSYFREKLNRILSRRQNLDFINIVYIHT